MRTFFKLTQFFLCLGIAACILLTGCTSINKKIIGQDRNSYNEELSKSESSQLLLNIVRLRYLDRPEFLQVNSITSQRMLSTTGAAAIALYNPYETKSAGSTLNPSVTYSDSPTVSFTPLQGQAFVNSLLTSVSLESLEHLCNVNWNIERVFLLAVAKINDNYNQDGTTTTESSQPPHHYFTFLKIIHDLYLLQQRNAIDFYYLKTPAGEEQMIAVFQANQEERLQLELKRLLHLSPHTKTIVFTTSYHITHQQNYVEIKTRSIYGMMSFLANTVHIPSQDKQLQQYHLLPIPVMTIYSSEFPVKGGIVTFYRGYYFYINENDASSKRTFLLFTDFYQLTAGLAGGNNGIVLTLPVSK